MSYEIGTATDYADLAAKLHTFLTAKGSAFAIQYVGTGNGTITGYRGGASAVAETWEITFTSATSATVVGSVSGSIGPATVGTPFAHAKIEFLLTAGGTAWVSGDKFTLATAPKWTGMRVPVSASVTRWRISWTGSASSSPVRIAGVEMATTPGGADQVAGSGGTATASSVTGSNAAANAADANDSTFFEHGSVGAGWWEYAFTGAKAIVEIRIKSTVVNSANGPIYFSAEYWDGTTWINAGTFANETAWGVSEQRTYRLIPYIWKAPGNDGAGEVYVGISPFQNAGAGFYNWRLGGFTAYSASSDFFNQPGSLKRPDVLGSTTTYGPILPLSNSSLGYWFVANGRRVVGVVKSGSTYGTFYLGLIAPYASPGQWPYPLLVGGGLWFETEPLFSSTQWLVGTAHQRHSNWPLPFTPLTSGTQSQRMAWSSAMLRKPDGTWLGFHSRSDFYDPKEDCQGVTWPYAHGFLNLKPDLDGNYSLMPIVLIERTPDNYYGQPDGVFAVTGSSLSAEATLTIGRDTYVAFNDATRSGAGDFFALKLD